MYVGVNRLGQQSATPSPAFLPLLPSTHTWAGLALHSRSSRDSGTDVFADHRAPGKGWGAGAGGGGWKGSVASTDANFRAAPTSNVFFKRSANVQAEDLGCVGYTHERGSDRPAKPLVGGKEDRGGLCSGVRGYG